jgi:hypothetical protein
VDWDEEDIRKMCKLDQELEAVAARGSRRPGKVDGGAGRPKRKTTADCMGATTGRGV